MLSTIAIIGLGQMGCAYAKYAASMAESLICYDSNSDQRKSFIERLNTSKNPFDTAIDKEIPTRNIKIVDDINKLWDEKPELSIITTHKESHCFYSIEAMKNNSHVLTEKPLCLNLNEAKAIEEKSILTKKHVYIGFSLHATPSFIKLKELVRAKPQIKSYSVYRIGAVPENYMAEVTARFDLLSHDTDFCIQLFGKPIKSIVNELSDRECHKIWEYSNFEVEMIGKMPITHPNGFEYGYSLAFDDDTHIEFSSNNPKEILKKSNKDGISRIQIDEISTCNYLLENVIKSIREDSYNSYIDHELSIKQGVNCMDMLINDQI